MKRVKANRVYSEMVEKNAEDYMEALMSFDGDMTEISIDDDDRAEGVDDDRRGSIKRITSGAFKRITSHAFDYDDEGLG